MKTFHKIFYFLTFLSILGCEETVNPGKPFYALSREPLFDIADNLDWRLVTKRMLLYEVHQWDLEQNKYTTYNKADAFFFDYQGGYVDAGIVNLNGEPVLKTTAEHLMTYEGPLKEQFISGISYYQDKAIDFNNSNYVWTVSGSKWVDSLSASIKSPAYKIELIKPLPNDEYSINEDIVIEWKFDPDTIAPVRIFIYNKDDSFVAFVSDTNSITIKPGMLEKFEGEVNFEILSGSYSLKQDPDLYYSIASVFSVWKMPLHLKK